MARPTREKETASFSKFEKACFSSLFLNRYNHVHARLVISLLSLSRNQRGYTYAPTTCHHLITACSLLFRRLFPKLLPLSFAYFKLGNSNSCNDSACLTLPCYVLFLKKYVKIFFIYTNTLNF